MAAPDSESVVLLAQIVGAAAAVGGPIWAVHAYLEKRFSKKADKESCSQENANCLRHIEKLYENAEEDRKLTRDLHDKAMERIQHNQTQLVDILGRSR
jgi:hypothetical protein